MLVIIVINLFRYNLVDEDKIPVEHHGQTDVDSLVVVQVDEGASSHEVAAYGEVC